jgi:lipopolysaccharide export system protein LptC
MYSHIERRSRGASSLRLSRLLAWLFGGIAIAMMAMLAYQAGTFSTLVPARPDVEPDTAQQAAPKQAREEITVSDSRFTGFDKNDQPFSISAKNAVQDENNSSRVLLVSVEAEIRRKTGQDVSIRSDQAIYDADSKTIDLEGDVRLSAKSGIVARMSAARVDIGQHRLRTEVPVHVVHPRAVIRSNGMEIGDDGARILFFNGVRARFGEAPGKGSAQ